MGPTEVKLIVYKARDLRIKKTGRCKFSVIFGNNSDRLSTKSVLEPGGNPFWYTSGVVKIKNAKDRVFFTVKESDNILGQVVIPASSLSAISDLIMTTPLQKHKKGPTPQGELVYKCVCTTSTGEQCVTRDAHTQTENVTLSSRSSCSVDSKYSQDIDSCSGDSISGRLGKKVMRFFRPSNCQEDLNEQLSMLQDQYLDLKTYTDRLVNEVMLHCPQLLEAGRFQF